MTFSEQTTAHRPDRGRRPSRWPVVTVLLLLVAAIVAAQAVQTTSAAGSAAAAASVTSETSDRDRGADAFTACMRSHGVPDFPGVTIAADGTVRLKGGNVKPLSAAYRTAASTCASSLPAGSELPADPAPPAPANVRLPFTCDGDCPATPPTPGAPA
jgi:cytochrome c553